MPLMIFGASWLIRQLVRRVRLRFGSQLLLFFVLVAGGSDATTLFGLDGIVGAFVAGIAARRAIGREEPTHVLKVVSNTFLIPAFFMATGMLIQPSVLLDTLLHQPLLALGLTAALVAGTFIAAWTTGQLFGCSRVEIGLCFA